MPCRSGSNRAKAAIYASAGVPVYWIVDLDAKRVEILEEPQQDGYAKQRVQGFTEELAVFGGSLTLGGI